jgi:hypothetical protein
MQPHPLVAVGLETDHRDPLLCGFNICHEFTPLSVTSKPSVTAAKCRNENYKPCAPSLQGENFTILQGCTT